jgi:hypothetical protein
LYKSILCTVIGVLFGVAATNAVALERIKYNHPGLVVDLGVGLWAWPLPMDYDGDGDNDLIVVCPDKPYSGTYFFENPGGKGAMPVFKPAVKIDKAVRNVQLSMAGGKPQLLSPGVEYNDFLKHGFAKPQKLGVDQSVHPGKLRANQWKYVDYEGDGDLDLIVGVGDWSAYGWDNAFDGQGNWTRGPLHGYVYLLRNTESNETPRYEKAVQLQAAGKVVDVYGMPSPSFADFDGDGDLDLICGEFLDSFSYFENVGTRKEPDYAAPRRLVHEGKPLHMDLQMITPVAFDWDSDGDSDLIVGDEDGRVAFVENLGTVTDGLPQFLPPRYFQQQAADVKFGALVTPVSFDWDNDGDEDLICGNTAGYVGFIENLDGGNPPKWAAPRYLKSDGKTLRIQAGPNGSIQGPCEAKWGYTTLSVADWNHDNLPDLVVNSIWGKVVWFKNIGTREEPKLAEARPIKVAWKDAAPSPAWNWWKPKDFELVTQWRTTPVVYDLNADGLNDLVMLDHDGYLAFFERRRSSGSLTLEPPKRIFQVEGIQAYDSRNRKRAGAGPIRMNGGLAGRSGRRKLCIADWDGDGRADLLVNSVNANLLRNLGPSDGNTLFEDLGPVHERILAGHTTSPTVVDWDRNGKPDLLLGGEDGFLYYMKNPN